MAAGPSRRTLSACAGARALRLVGVGGRAGVGEDQGLAAATGAGARARRPRSRPSRGRRRSPGESPRWSSSAAASSAMRSMVRRPSPGRRAAEAAGVEADDLVRRRAAPSPARPTCDRSRGTRAGTAPAGPLAADVVVEVVPPGDRPAFIVPSAPLAPRGQPLLGHPVRHAVRRQRPPRPGALPEREQARADARAPAPSTPSSSRLALLEEQAQQPARVHDVVGAVEDPARVEGVAVPRCPRAARWPRPPPPRQRRRGIVSSFRIAARGVGREDVGLHVVDRVRRPRPPRPARRRRARRAPGRRRDGEPRARLAPGAARGARPPAPRPCTRDVQRRAAPRPRARGRGLDRREDAEGRQVGGVERAPAGVWLTCRVEPRHHRHVARVDAHVAAGVEAPAEALHRPGVGGEQGAASCRARGRPGSRPCRRRTASRPAPPCRSSRGRGAARRATASSSEG